MSDVDVTESYSGVIDYIFGTRYCHDFANSKGDVFTFFCTLKQASEVCRKGGYVVRKASSEELI